MLTLDVTKKYALAVSGGIDSMVMLHAFANHLPRPNFFVVTVNHNIRQNSLDDCLFVQDYCQKLGVECSILDVDVPTHAKQNKLSLETSARILRYQVLQNVECDYVCVAHHKGDNAETILMHLFRGSGTVGAKGMFQYNGKYFRPLLNISKQQIISYATQNQIPFVNDYTNDDVTYTRNFVRHKVLPLVEEVFPSVEQNILRFAENVAQDDEFLQSLAVQQLEKVVFEKDVAKIPLEIFSLHNSIVYRVLSGVFQQLGIFYDIERVHYQSICEVAQNVGGKQTHLPFDLVAYNDYDFVTICKSQNQSKDHWQISFAVGTTQTPLGKVVVSTQPMEGSLKFDIKKVPPTAVFRTRRTGDLFCKFGGGTKLLKDYLIDKKIPQRERDNLVLIADGNKVLAICNVEISQKIKTGQPTHTVYLKLIKED